ncbi:hypothetical protein OUZ56_002997 [Daphnia magna]|uniref:Uncharacterized protein n=1 Tax=Daphnia magna TaxID=35525 RepID=A0ABR0A7D7_9CRUS|nr:hypothetical protein OUZ56_002997 [Daphnia magna]
MKANLIAVQSNALVTLILPRAQVPLNKRRWWSRLCSNSPPSFSGLRGDIYVKKKRENEYDYSARRVASCCVSCCSQASPPFGRAQ